MAVNNAQGNFFFRPWVVIPLLIIGVSVIFGFGLLVGRLVAPPPPPPVVADGAAQSSAAQAPSQSAQDKAVLSESEGAAGGNHAQSVPVESSAQPGSGHGDAGSGSGFMNVATNPNQSACGLKGEMLERTTLTEAPSVDEWRYHKAIAYPYSAEFGPAAENGPVRYCFQHSPEGALYAVANSVAQGNDTTTSGKWIRYAFAEGPVKDEVVSNDHPDEGKEIDLFRIEIQGFRMLSYEGDKATVDLALSLEMGGKTMYVSMLHNVIWENNDWKLHHESIENPNDMAQLPHLDGYILWGPDM